MSRSGATTAEVVAAADDGTHGPQVLARLTDAHPSRLDEVRGDSKYNNRTLDRDLVTSRAKYTLTVVDRPPGVTGLVLLPYRWVVVRTNACTGKYRRNSKDDERTTAVSEASAIHPMLNRLAPDPDAPRPTFRYPANPDRVRRPFPDRLEHRPPLRGGGESV